MLILLSDTICINFTQKCSGFEKRAEVKKSLNVWTFVPIVGYTNSYRQMKRTSCQWVKNGISIGHKGQHLFQNILTV
jgi:hypothetical protein